MRIVLGGRPETEADKEPDMTVVRVDVWWVSEFKTWAVTKFNKDGDTVETEGGEANAYYHYKADAKLYGKHVAELWDAELRVFTKAGGI